MLTREDSTIVVNADLERDPPADPVADRRADVEAKLAAVGAILPDLGCEAVVLFMPAHVSWLCGGFNLRGLFADNAVWSMNLLARDKHVMPWRIEDEMKRLGANYIQAGQWRSFAVRDGTLAFAQTLRR